MSQPRLYLRHVPERFAVALVAGLLAWWLTHSAVPFWWVALPCVALGFAALFRRAWRAWLAWGTATGGRATLLALTLRSPRAEVKTEIESRRSFHSLVVTIK